jgi:eukaryotic-like serine/threonine-protein kinase
MSLLAELKRRRVFRVAAVYVVVGFALIQAVDIIFPALNLPSWTVSAVVVLAILGLPAAIALAWAFDITPDGLRRTAPRSAVPAPAAPARPASRPPLWQRHRAVWFALGFAVALSAGWLAVASRGEGGDAGLDANRVAVLPFRVSADPSLSYLREGMVDLLAAKLTGDVGPQAVDTRTLLAVWRRAGGGELQDLPQEQAQALARQLGAGQLLTGEVVGSPQRLVLNASLTGTAGGRVTRASEAGPADSLPWLVDRLAVALLSLQAGEDEQRLPALTSTSFPALVAYLEGQRMYRNGQYEDAALSMERAVLADSSFALAALGLRVVAGWVSGTWQRRTELGSRIAWQGRDRLGPRDRAVLESYTGDAYPRPLSATELLHFARRASEVAPERPETWYELGDAHYHAGPYVGHDDHIHSARSAFRRALAIDATHTAALEHLIEVEALRRDTAALRDLAAAYLGRHGDAELAEYHRWRIARALGDTASLAALRTRFDRMTPPNLWRVIGWGAVEPAAQADAALAVAALRRMDGPPGERSVSAHRIAAWEMARGRPRAAVQALDALPGAAPMAWHGVADAITMALYWARDAELAGRLAQRLEAMTPDPAGDPAGALHAACVLELWRLEQGRTATAEATRDRVLEGVRRFPASQPGLEMCATTIDALHAVQTGRADAAAAVDRLDRLSRTGPDWAGGYLNVPLARLLAELGDHERALAATRRRFFSWSAPYNEALYRDEGRLAAAAGDRTAAIAAFQHFLAVRTDPEPALRPEVDAVRAELARLLGDG